MSPSAPWLCIDSLWHGDQNCQCFLSQQWQNVVMSCMPGEVLVRLGHVRGGRFHVPSSQGDSTFTSPKASFCLVGSLPLGMGNHSAPFRNMQSSSWVSSHSRVAPTQSSSLKVFMNSECRTW